MEEYDKRMQNIRKVIDATKKLSKLVKEGKEGGKHEKRKKAGKHAKT